MSIDPAAAARAWAALQAVAQRPARAVPWQDGSNLPWDEPAFSERMLREHLDQAHGAASRPRREIRAQVQYIRRWLQLAPGDALLDVTCGPGLYAAEFARAGLSVTGIDFSPASIAYAQELCQGLGCAFLLGDVRQMDFAGAGFAGAIYLYGQFTVLPPAEVRDVLRRLHAALRPGARLLLEVLDDEHLDKSDSNWWFTGEGGLWGDFPYLHLGERYWDAEQRAAIDRFHILNLETGVLQVYGLSDQAYTHAEMVELLEGAGFAAVEAHPAWDGLALKDASEWVVYVAQRV